MFGIDFSELMVIMLVALIVIGPERLPKVARTLGFLWGRAQRYVNSVKADISRDLAIDEFRQLQQQVQQEAGSAELAVKQVTQNLDQQVQQLTDSVARPAQVAGLQAAKDNSLPDPAVSKHVPSEPQTPAESQKFPVD
jgi:sec-independent protein translocase protein TatB